MNKPTVYLSRENLLPEFRDLPTDEVRFEHLDSESQSACVTYGNGRFYGGGNKLTDVAWLRVPKAVPA